MIVTLPYAARALVLFLCLAVITLLICDAPVRLWQTALLASLFALPFLLLMAGDFTRPSFFTAAQFADWQLKALSVLSALSPRLPLVLVLLMMAAFMNGYVRVGLLPDEQKRNAVESIVQAGMIAYVVILTLFIRVRSIVRNRSQQGKLSDKATLC